MRTPLALGIIALALLSGLVAGYLYWPHWSPPRETGEIRLRQRAESYYRAQREADFRGIALSFTPARQIAEAAELLKRADELDHTRRGFDKETRDDLKRSAETITGDKLEVTVEDGWALTGGAGTLITQGVETSMPLLETVWVQSGGEWWVYSMTQEELNAYGNPPDWGRRLLSQQKLMSISPGQMQQTGEVAPREGEAQGDAAGPGGADAGSEGNGGEGDDG